MSFVVYGLCDPRFVEDDLNHVFYIGKSTDGKTRPGKHATPSSLRNDDKNNWQKAERIRELIALFPLQGYTIKILEELPAPSKDTSPEDQLPNATALGILERQYIRWARSIGWKILNLTDGGENIVGPMLGKKVSDKTRRLLSIATSGSKNPNFGKTASIETRQKQSLAKLGKKSTVESRQKQSVSLLGEKNPFFGKTHSIETKKVMSSLKLGRALSEGTKQKLSEANKGKEISEAQKSKISATLIGHAVSVESRSRMSESAKIAWARRKAVAL